MKKLAAVKNRQGRVDVLLYQMAERYMARVETDQGLVGLREHLWPMVEKAIRRNVPGRNVITPELRGIMAVLNENLKRRGC